MRHLAALFTLAVLATATTGCDQEPDVIGSCVPDGIGACFEYRPVDGEIAPTEDSLRNGPTCQGTVWRDAPCDVRMSLGGCSLVWSSSSTGAVVEEIIWYEQSDAYPSQAAVIESCERQAGTFVEPM